MSINDFIPLINIIIIFIAIIGIWYALQIYLLLGRQKKMLILPLIFVYGAVVRVIALYDPTLGAWTILPFWVLLLIFFIYLRDSLKKMKKA